MRSPSCAPELTELAREMLERGSRVLAEKWRGIIVQPSRTASRHRDIRVSGKNATFELEIELEEAGWCNLRIRSGRQAVSASCSYVVDTLGNLIRGFASLSKCDGKCEIE